MRPEQTEILPDEIEDKRRWFEHIVYRPGLILGILSLPPVGMFGHWLFFGGGAFFGGIFMIAVWAFVGYANRH